MRKSRFTEHQFIAILMEVKQGASRINFCNITGWSRVVALTGRAGLAVEGFLQAASMEEVFP